MTVEKKIGLVDQQGTEERLKDLSLILCTAEAWSLPCLWLSLVLHLPLLTGVVSLQSQEFH